LSPAHLSRHFENKDALLEAIAEHWFRPKVAIMDEVMSSDLPARRKMFEFFARRFVVMRDTYLADPATFQMYVEIGDEHFELVRSYVDLADHYLGEIIGEAMGEGYFTGLGVDEAISLVNQMTTMYTMIRAMPMVMDRLSLDKLARIIDAVFDGLSAQDRGAKSLSGLRAA
jgi:AcrR family transcriptional regulator